MPSTSTTEEMVPAGRHRVLERLLRQIMRVSTSGVALFVRMFGNDVSHAVRLMYATMLLSLLGPAIKVLPPPPPASDGDDCDSVVGKHNDGALICDGQEGGSKAMFHLKERAVRWLYV